MQESKPFYKHVKGFNNEVLSLQNVYYNYTRPVLKQHQKQKQFFLTTSLSSRYYRQEVWAKVGLLTQSGPTLFRKTAVTTIHQKN